MAMKDPASPKFDDKLHESKIELLGSRRSPSDSNHSAASLDIHGLVRGLQARVEVLQYEIKVDAGQVRRLHARIDLLENDLSAINDREKRQGPAGWAVEGQNDDPAGSLP